MTSKTDSSIAFLVKSPFCHLGEPISNESLILTILHITQYAGIPHTIVEGLRATALLLEDGLATRPNDSNTVTPDIQQIIDSISNSLSTQIVATLSSSLSAHVIAAISPQVASILTASKTLKTNVDEITKVKTMLAEQPGTPKLYSAAVQQNTQTLAPILAALVCAAARDRQILFNPTPGQVLFAPEVTSADIVGKIMQAFVAS